MAEPVCLPDGSTSLSSARAAIRRALDGVATARTELGVAGPRVWQGRAARMFDDTLRDRIRQLDGLTQQLLAADAAVALADQQREEAHRAMWAGG
ncbi:MAG: hypothetical protein ACYC1Z_12270 [Georgenia sp.]